MNQLCLVLPLARSTDPQTSHDAAERVASVAVSHRNRIMAALDTPGTVKEIAQRCGLDHVRVGKRMVELKRLGLAAETDAPPRDGCREWARA